MFSASKQQLSRASGCSAAQDLGDERAGAPRACCRAGQQASARLRRAGLFEHVAKRWSLTLGTQVSPAQVVLCLVDLKVARLARDPKHLDSMVDVAGYAAVLREVSR